MLYWTWRQWLYQPGRNLLAATVFAVVLALFLLFEGLRQGVLEDLGAYAASLPADLVLLERGSPYVGLSFGSLPQPARSEAEAVPGVVEAHPLAMVPVILGAGGRRSPAVLVAYESLGAPERLTAGRVAASPSEVVVDSALARRHGLHLEDRIEVLNRSMIVTGLSTGTTSPFAPFLFVTYDELIDWLMDADLSVGVGDLSLLTALLLKTDRVSPALREALAEAVPEASPHTPDELGQALTDFGRRSLGPVLLLMSAVAWLIGALTMALLRYAQLRHQMQEHSVQAALGASPLALATAVTAGGALTAVVAMPLALLLAHGLGQLTMAWNPLYVPRVWAPEVLVRGGLGLLLATLAGSMLILPRLLKLDPARAFGSGQ